MRTGTQRTNGKAGCSSFFWLSRASSSGLAAATVSDDSCVSLQLVSWSATRSGAPNRSSHSNRRALLQLDRETPRVVTAFFLKFGRMRHTQRSGRRRHYECRCGAANTGPRRRRRTHMGAVGDARRQRRHETGSSRSGRVRAWHAKQRNGASWTRCSVFNCDCQPTAMLQQVHSTAGSTGQRDPSDHMDGAPPLAIRIAERDEERPLRQDASPSNLLSGDRRVGDNREHVEETAVPPRVVWRRRSQLQSDGCMKGEPLLLCCETLHLPKMRERLTTRLTTNERARDL